MTSITFKELCLDTCLDSAGAPGSAGRFWAQVTGCRFESGPDDPAGAVLGEQEGMGIAMCPVPEDKTVKNRVHLDVSVGALADVVALGATVVETHEHWTVCADPEGNEFCAFVRADELPGYRAFEFVVDSVDPEASARWWGERFGVPAQNEGQPWWWLTGVDGFPTAGPFFAMVFGPVPEAKTVKNRMHWDLYGDPADFVDAGARFLWEEPGRTRPIAWTTLADPEGNEFCVFPR